MSYRFLRANGDLAARWRILGALYELYEGRRLFHHGKFYIVPKATVNV